MRSSISKGAHFAPRLASRFALVVVLALACVACSDAAETTGDEATPRASSSTLGESVAEDIATPSGATTTRRAEGDDGVRELRSGLEEVSAESEVRLGVYVVELGVDPPDFEVGIDEDAPFESASLIKLLVLAELLKRVDAGEVSLEESLGGSTVRALAEAMISTSDNAATNLLIDRLGFESINATARDLGLSETRLERKMLDFEARARGEENYTSASDAIALLSEFWDGDLLSPGSREFALSALEAQTLDSKLPAYLSPEVRVLHKTGELQNIEHDAGILILPDGRALAVAALTSGDSASGAEAVRRVGALSYESFAGSGSRNDG